MKIRSNFKNRPIIKKEKGSGKKLVETAGYIPAKRRIEDMIACGERLVSSRRNYDFPDGIPKGVEPSVDPTRKPGIDLAEVSTMARDVNARLRSQKGRKVEKVNVPPTPITEGDKATADSSSVIPNSK